MLKITDKEIRELLDVKGDRHTVLTLVLKHDYSPANAHAHVERVKTAPVAKFTPEFINKTIELNNLIEQITLIDHSGAESDFKGLEVDEDGITHNSETYDYRCRETSYGSVYMSWDELNKEDVIEHFKEKFRLAHDAEVKILKEKQEKQHREFLEKQESKEYQQYLELKKKFPNG